MPTAEVGAAPAFILALLMSGIDPGAGTPPAPAAAFAPQELIARTRPGLVLIEAVTADSAEIQGTGFLLDAGGHVLTNYQVIHDACVITVKQGTQSVSSVGILLADPVHDIAVLAVKGLAGVPLDLGRAEDLVRGSRVTTLFYSSNESSGREVISSAGTYSGTRDFGEGEVFLRIGDSGAQGAGGGVIFDEKGRVAGIATDRLPFQVSSGEDGRLATPIDRVRRIDLSGDAKDPRALCRESRTGATEPEPAANPRDERAAFESFRAMMVSVLASVRDCEMRKASDLPPVPTEIPPSKLPDDPIEAALWKLNEIPSTPVPYSRDRYRFNAQWYATSPRSAFDVYAVDADWSPVVTFVGYIEIPTTTYHQEVLMKSARSEGCDGLSMSECAAHGGTVTGQSATRTSSASSIWGLVYQGGVWRIARVLSPDAAKGFLKAVAAKDRLRIYQAITGTARSPR